MSKDFSMPLCFLFHTCLVNQNLKRTVNAIEPDLKDDILFLNVQVRFGSESAKRESANPA